MHNILQIISILCITETVGQQLHISNTVGWLIIVYNNYSGRKQYTTQNSIQEKNVEIQFFSYISYTIVLFDSKHEFRMISAFIWYAYCLCLWRIIIFQKFVCQKLENPCVKLGHFGVTLRKNYGSYKVAQSFYRCKKIPNFIWDHVWTDLGRNLGRRSPKSLSSCCCNS